MLSLSQFAAMVRLSWVLLVLPGFGECALAQPSPMAEPKLKAAFLYNFARFTEWLPQDLQSGKAISICVLGRDDVYDELSAAVNGKSIDDHPLAAKRLADLKNVEACQILFLATSRVKEFRAWQRLKNPDGILTVGDDNQYEHNGSVMNFVSKGDRIAFAVDLDALSKAHLKLNSKLLSMARLNGEKER